MKVLVCILVLVVSSVHGGFLQKSRGQQSGWSSAPQKGWSSAPRSGWSSAPRSGWSAAPQKGWSGPSLRQSRPPQVIKVIHSQGDSDSHANIQSGPVKIVKVIQESGPSVADLRSSNGAPAKIIRIIHHDDGPSGDYGRSAGSQEAKIVKIVRESSANSYSASGDQNVKVIKIIKQSNDELDSSSSYGSNGWTSDSYSSGWDQGRSAPSPVVKVIKVVQKQSKW